MSHRTVLTHPNAVLREKSRALLATEILSDELQTLVDDMKQTTKDDNGVGLAAPQIGEHIRLIICETKKGLQAYFNPEITERSDRMTNSEEGCLSIPKVFGVVARHKTVTVKALDRTGAEVVIKAKGLLSVIFQHEIDHLDGILFIDRAHTIHDMTDEKRKQLI